MQKEGLHPELKKVTFQISETKSHKKIRKISFKKAFFLSCIKIGLRVLGMNHYNAQSIVGYTSHLFSDKTIKEKIIPNGSVKNLLDIGAADGSITEKFESYAENIYFLETGKSFQKKLTKRGYKNYAGAKGIKCDMVIILNILDICKDPEEIIQTAKKSLIKNGTIIVSLPFPIRLGIHDGSIRKTNSLKELKDLDYTTSINTFYEKKLKKWGLRVEGFAEIKYIVQLGDSTEPWTYNNAVFICKKKVKKSS